MLPSIVAAYVSAGVVDTGTTDVPAASTRLDSDGLAAAAAALGLSKEEVSQFFDRWVYNHELLRTTDPGTLRADAVLLRAELELDRRLRDGLHVADVPLEAWRSRLDGHVDIRPVPGDHLSCMGDPANLSVVAKEVDRWIASLT